MLGLLGKAAVVSTSASSWLNAGELGMGGALAGEPIAVKFGEKVLAEGGNAIDAAITAALAACIASPSKCGIGGYGGHAIVATAKGKVVAVDFNAIAPAAATPDMFSLDERGKVRNNANVHGWLAAGVPGTLAGFELILHRFGTRSVREVLGPAIELCHEGVRIPPFPTSLDDASTNNAAPDTLSQASTAKRKNLPLARLLETLANRNSVESFYRGDVAASIASAFQKNGGLITTRDMAAYRARELDPITMKWNGMELNAVPLTSPGASVIQALSILKELDWTSLTAPEQLHAKVDAIRTAWADRLQYFGDPEFVQVPLSRLLSKKHVSDLATKISAAVKSRKPLALQSPGNEDAGTINISAADRHGNMIAITFTHGGSYGAQVAVQEYGLVLGHGMWRFDPRPGLPNSVAPRKRSITNMCPAIVMQAGKARLAVGGAGGTRIPNSVFEVLLNYVGAKRSMQEALDVPRLTTTGSLEIGVETRIPQGEKATLEKLGYKVVPATSAFVSAAAYDPDAGKFVAAMR